MEVPGPWSNLLSFATSCVALNQGSVPPPALPGFIGTMSPSVTLQCPACPSRASGWTSRSSTSQGFPCCVCIPDVHAVANTPAEQLGTRVARTPSHGSLPRIDRQVGLRITLFGDCSAFTRVTACTFAKSPTVTLYTRGFSCFVISAAAPIASGWSDSCRVGLTPTGNTAPFHGARQSRVRGRQL